MNSSKKPCYHPFILTTCVIYSSTMINNRSSVHATHNRASRTLEKVATRRLIIVPPQRHSLAWISGMRRNDWNTTLAIQMTPRSVPQQHHSPVAQIGSFQGRTSCHRPYYCEFGGRTTSRLFVSSTITAISERGQDGTLIPPSAVFSTHHVLLVN